MKRRNFIKRTGVTAAGAVIIPTIIPSTVFGKTAPSNQISVGMVGTGRQAVNANLKNGFLKLNNCRVIAVNDVDSWRMTNAEEVINNAYSSEGKKQKALPAGWTVSSALFVNSTVQLNWCITK